MLGKSAAKRDTTIPGACACPAGAAVQKPSRWRRILRGVLSAAVCLVTAVATFSAAPAVMAMSEHQDVVRWFNRILDLVAQ